MKHKHAFGLLLVWMVASLKASGTTARRKDLLCARRSLVTQQNAQGCFGEESWGRALGV